MLADVNIIGQTSIQHYSFEIAYGECHITTATTATLIIVIHSVQQQQE